MNKSNYFCKNISYIFNKHLKNNVLNGRLLHSKSETISEKPIRIAVIGSGPSGFYITQHLLKVRIRLVSKYNHF